MKRGEIYYANLEPAIGSEANKKRPVLIISNDANNKASATITILPITSNTNKVYPFEVLLSAKKVGLSKASKVQCQQVRTISKSRILASVIGKVETETLHRIEASLKLHLGL